MKISEDPSWLHVHLKLYMYCSTFFQCLVPNCVIVPILLGTHPTVIG